VELLKCFSDPLRIIHPSSLTASIFVQGAWSVSPLLWRYAIWNTEIVIHMTCIWSYHPASSLPAQLRLHFLFLRQLLCHEVGACLDQERANCRCQGALTSMLHIECVLLSADTQKDKFGTSSFLWASFSAGAISDSCESSLLLRFSPPCCLSLECTRNSLLWLGATCSTILCCDGVRHCLGRQEGT
jgi:hypothetical protein